MKASKFLIIVILFSFGAITPVSAKNATLGESVYLNYSSSGAWGCDPIYSPPGYSGMTPGANTSGGYSLTAGNSGNFTLQCWNGGGGASASDYLNVTAATPPGGASCNGWGYQGWGIGCSANVSGSTADGGTLTVYNTAAGLNGSQQFTCSNGTFTYVNGSETCTSSSQPPTPSPTPTPTPPSPQNGYCGVATYTCQTGVPGGQSEDATSYSWNCSGFNGGSPAYCSNLKPCANGANNPTACSTCPLGQVMSGGTCTAQVWTSYCTGGSDVNGNNWQVWEYDNASTPNYRNTGGTCNPTPTFSASPSSLTYNTASTLTWSAGDAISCTASGDWAGAKAVSGTQSTGQLTSSKTYGLTCTNAYGQSSLSIINVPVTVCSFATPTWNGSSCVGVTGNITANTCTIPVGGASCAMDIAWSTTNPPGLIEVRRNYDAGSVLATGPNGNISRTFPYSSTPYILDLYDDVRNVLLDSANFTASCAAGGWDTISDTCVNPLVTSVAVTGQYYQTPGNLRVTCTGSNRYTVRNADLGTVVASGAYTIPVNVPVVTSGNYSATCQYGSFSSTPTLRYYNAPPPPLPTIALTASPRTVSKSSQTTLNWSIKFPVAACTFSVKAVCTNNRCSTEQLNAATTLTTKLRNESTDSTDVFGSRSLNSSIRTIAPGHEDTDWMALGKKTIRVSNTSDISIDCGGGKKATTRVQVTSSIER